MIENSSGHTITLQVYDILGKLVLQNNNTTNLIDISSLKSGIFFIKITTDQGVLTKKLVKK